MRIKSKEDELRLMYYIMGRQRKTKILQSFRTNVKRSKQESIHKENRKGIEHEVGEALLRL